MKSITEMTKARAGAKERGGGKTTVKAHRHVTRINTIAQRERKTRFAKH